MRENASFLMDLRCLTHWEDLKADMNGVYDGFIRCGKSTVAEVDGDWNVLHRQEVPLTSQNEYHFLQHSKRNKAASTLSRSIFLLKDYEGKYLNNVALLQYNVDNEDGYVQFEVQGHGNRKSIENRPYFPTKKSTMDSIKAGLICKPAASVYDEVRRSGGGATNAKNPSDIPRGRQQVYSFKSRSSLEEKTDDVADLLKYARDKDDLVLHHADFPDDLWVLGTTVMCQDLERFTTSDILSHPVSIDPTFNMGQFEVTPIVYKHLFLKSKRMGESPIFLGPTMIHHKKTYETYRTFASKCASTSPKFRDAKGFVTDGEMQLQNAFKDELKSARPLRCFKHFEGNCRETLRKIGIREKKDQRYFIEKTFGVKDKVEGILDALNGHDLRRRLDLLRSELEAEEKKLLQQQGNDAYVPKYWEYINKHYDMIRKHMIEKVRRKAGMVQGDDGKALRCYTNNSESMNKVLKSAKEAYGRSNQGVVSLNKIQFTKHVFEVVHSHEQEELKSAISGLSDEYELQENAAHLKIPSDVWFEWTSEMRSQYIKGIQKLTIEEVMQHKDVPWPQFEISNGKESEFKDLQVDFKKELVTHFGYSQEGASTLETEVIILMNHPHAIQRKACIETNGNTQFEVASKNTKQGTVSVTSYNDHTSCICGRFRHDGICKHSLAVACLQKILEQHLDFIRKKFKNKSRHTSLAEHGVSKNVAGKKGSRNESSYRPPKKVSRVDGACSSNVSKSGNPFTEIHHNENQFRLLMLPEDAIKCKSCDVNFCHRQRVIPFDMVLAHEERWYYPVEGDWSKKRASSRETTRYYHTSKQCILQRFPYFTPEYVDISSETLAQVRDSHKKYLNAELGLKFV